MSDSGRSLKEPPVSWGEGLCRNAKGVAPVLGDFGHLRQGPEAGVDPLRLGHLGSVTTGWSDQKIHPREHGLLRNNEISARGAGKGKFCRWRVLEGVKYGRVQCAGCPKHGNFVSEFTLYSQFPAPVLGAGGSPGISNGHRSKGCDRLAAFTSV